MPNTDLMGWNKREKRWFKKYRSMVYAVSPKQLGTERSKEASRQAANEWWTEKQAKIDAALGIAKKHPAPLVRQYNYAIENHRLFAKWHRKYGDAKQAEKSETMMEWLKEALQSDNPAFPLKRFREDPLWKMKQDEAGFLLWGERIMQIRREEREEKAVPKENTIRAHVDDYLAFRRTRVASGKNTLGTFDTYRGRLLTFRNWVDPFAPVEALNEALWERYYTYLSRQVEAGKLTASTMCSTLNAAREFIKSRWERKFIELPRNLNSRSLTVSPPVKEIEVFTVEEVKTLLASALEREQLFLLLMLNCGFYPVDIAMLRKSEYQNGRICRKRTKTRNRSEKVPSVDYLLWKETNTLLKKHQSTHPEFVLVNRNGSPLWHEVEKDGKFCRVSNIKCSFFRLQRKTGIHKPLKLLRKTAASMLEAHAQYGRYAEYFLGEAPSSVASRHYVKPSSEQFDAALRWLGEQFGF